MHDPGSGTERTGAAAGARRDAPRYAERLHVTWYWWPLPLLAATILAAEIHGGYGGVRAWLPYVVLIPLTAGLIVRMGWVRIAVEDGELRVGDARLPLESIGAVEVFTAAEKRRALGPNLDPAALVLHRGWVGPVLRVQLTDPTGPIPYWLFSSRHPERLAEIIRTVP